MLQRAPGGGVPLYCRTWLGVYFCFMGPSVQDACHMYVQVHASVYLRFVRSTKINPKRPKKAKRPKESTRELSGRSLCRDNATTSLSCPYSTGTWAFGRLADRDVKPPPAFALLASPVACCLHFAHCRLHLLDRCPDGTEIQSIHLFNSSRLEWVFFHRLTTSIIRISHRRA